MKKLDNSEPTKLPATVSPQKEVANRGQSAVSDIGAELRKPKMGAPTIRNPIVDDEIFERLVGGESLLSITYDDRMPSWPTVSNWRRDDQSFNEMITSGMMIGQHVLIDVVQDIARAGRFSTGSIERDKLLIQTIMNVASKRNRAEFGDKLTVDQRIINITLDRKESDW
jgi:hypothetical protein